MAITECLTSTFKTEFNNFVFQQFTNKQVVSDKSGANKKLLNFY